MEESLGKILVGTLLVFKLDVMDRNSEYKVVKQVLRAQNNTRNWSKGIFLSIRLKIERVFYAAFIILYKQAI